MIRFFLLPLQGCWDKAIIITTLKKIQNFLFFNYTSSTHYLLLLLCLQIFGIRAICCQPTLTRICGECCNLWISNPGIFPTRLPVYRMTPAHGLSTSIQQVQKIIASFHVMSCRNGTPHKFGLKCSYLSKAGPYSSIFYGGY